MHSISPYSIRISKKNSRGDKKYLELHKAGLLPKLFDFISCNCSVLKDDNLKQTYLFSDVTYDDKNNKLYGWFMVGHHGMVTEIVNSDTGMVDYNKQNYHAELIKHYFQISLHTDGCDEGICAFHSSRGNGIKTLFNKLFEEYIDLNGLDWTVTLRALAYEKAFKEWSNANVKEVVVTKFKGLPDVTDNTNEENGIYGHFELPNVKLKPKSKIPFSDLFIKGSDGLKAVEMLKPLGEQVKVVAKIRGKRRTFKIGADPENSVCQIELDKSVDIIDGTPNLESIHNWTNDIIKEFHHSLYPSS